MILRGGCKGGGPVRGISGTQTDRSRGPPWLWGRAGEGGLCSGAGVLSGPVTAPTQFISGCSLGFCLQLQGAVLPWPSAQMMGRKAISSLLSSASAWTVPRGTGHRAVAAL